MTSVDTLALRAREALAHCGGGSLHIQGVGHPELAAAEILLYDDGGRPTFLCDPASPVARAAAHRRAAVLAVVPPPRDWEQLSALVLSGHLRVVGSERVDGASVTVVGLQVESVTAERDDPRTPTVVQRDIPLAEFDAAVPDPVAAAAARILRHTNHCHGAQLRTFVASVRGVATTEIAAAELVGLDVTGLDVTWLDRRGAHAARIRFTRPADSPGTLSAP